MRELNESRTARVVVVLKGEGIVGGSRVCDSGGGGCASHDCGLWAVSVGVCSDLRQVYAGLTCCL